MNETSQLIRHLQAQVRAKRFQISRLHSVLEKVNTDDGLHSSKPHHGQTIGTRVEQLQGEILKLELRIQKLCNGGAGHEEHSIGEPEISPLELLGLTFLLKEDGKINETQFNQIVLRVRGLIKNGG